MFDQPQLPIFLKGVTTKLLGQQKTNNFNLIAIIKLKQNIKQHPLPQSFLTKKLFMPLQVGHPASIQTKPSLLYERSNSQLSLAHCSDELIVFISQYQRKKYALVYTQMKNDQLEFPKLRSSQINYSVPFGTFQSSFRNSNQKTQKTTSMITVREPKRQSKKKKNRTIPVTEQQKSREASEMILSCSQEKHAQQQISPFLRKKFNITHRCACISSERDCNEYHCPCYITDNELCVEGECCLLCVHNKNSFFRQKKGWKSSEEEKLSVSEPTRKIQELVKKVPVKSLYYYKKVHPKESWLKQIRSCTCKRSQCQSNYCMCFYSKQKCGHFCTCKGCNNQAQHLLNQEMELKLLWQKYMTQQRQGSVDFEHLDESIDQFFQEMDLSEKIEIQMMEFEPPNFQRMWIDGE